MSKVILYHNPRCSKSRAALQLLQDHGISPTIIEYLKNPPTVPELQKIIKLLKLNARDLLRKKESEYKKLKLHDENLTEQDILRLCVQYPILLERPIVVVNDKAVIARPTELLLEILS